MTDPACDAADAAVHRKLRTIINSSTDESTRPKNTTRPPGVAQDEVDDEACNGPVPASTPVKTEGGKGASDDVLGADRGVFEVGGGDS